MVKPYSDIILPHGIDDLKYGVDLLATEVNPEARGSIVKKILSDISPLVASGASSAVEFEQVLKMSQTMGDWPARYTHRDVERAFTRMVTDCAEHIGRHNYRIEHVVAARKKGGNTRSQHEAQRLVDLQPKYDTFWGLILAVLAQDSPPPHYTRYLDYLWDDEQLGKLTVRVRQKLHANLAPRPFPLSQCDQSLHEAINQLSRSTNQPAKARIAIKVLETCSNPKK